MIMKGFYIQISNGLLERKHYENMGQAVWLFMWLLDKMTSVSEEGVGLVLGGKPIKFEEVEEDLGMSYATYKRWVSTLRKAGYVETTRTSFGYKFKVIRAQKTFGQKSESSKMSHQSDSSNMGQRELNNAPVIAQKCDEHSRQDKDITTDKTGIKDLTPGEIARDFFSAGECYAMVVDSLSKKYDREAVESELQKFILYWTEPNKSGSKVRWEGEKTFEVKRRIITWLNNSRQFKSSRVPSSAMAVI